MIAEYYEELGVKLLDNNRAMDAEINELDHQTQLTNGFDSEYRKSMAKIQHNDLMNDFKTIKVFRNALVDPAFRLHIHKFEGRCEYYLYLLDRYKTANKRLLEALENKNSKQHGSTSSSTFRS